MPLTEKLCFVQFLHPQSEPSRNRGSRWNTGNHVRKYLRTDGTYLSGDQAINGPIEFWGEWEAESVVAREFQSGDPQGPGRVWRPCYEKKTDYRGLQNTDPFVFGGFFYTGCQQHTQQGPTQLRYLSRGSVVLFGSRVGGIFALDTVFVVDRWVDHDVATYRSVLRGRVPEAYWDVTLGPRYSDTDPLCGPRALVCLPEEWESDRLYIGATYDRQVDGMFSFVPCLRAGFSSSGFPRPTIELPGMVNPRLTRKYRSNPQRSTVEVEDLWRQVVEQVLCQGLDLGISVSVPGPVGSVPP